MLSVRVVTVDHYISRPIKQLSGRNKDSQEKHWSEPVIRIFGSTHDGIKTCVNIHGVYPYIYVPYKGGENSERDALLLAAALDQALAASSKSKTSRFVYRVVLTSGIPLYGYHSRPRQFFKIYFFNAYHIRKAADLLLSGAILGQRFQPHEAHIPFTLQFMIDYNIHGMSFINLEKVKYRRSPANPGSLRGIDKSQILPASVKRTSHSYWEVDALAEDILNNRSSRGSLSVNPGLEAIWEDEKNRRRAQKRPSQITQQASDARPEVKPTPNEVMHRQRLAEKLRDVAVEVRDTSPESGPELSYPAEVPDDAVDILEASVVGVAGVDLPPGDLLGDVSDLIDEKMLTQIVGACGSEETDSESEQVRIEDDSVLGRNQRDEDEAEPGDEDGGDMTQPLEMLESVIRGEHHADRRERGGDSLDSENEFWKNMADKIMQLDGADDLSSMDSDEENRRSVERSQCQAQLLSKEADNAVEGILGSSSPGNESMTNWSNNIMSILNEGSGYSVPASGYQTSQTFWSNWSPRLNQSEPLWPPQSNADAWPWDKADSAFLDCLSYPVKKGKAVDNAPHRPEESFQAQSAGDAINPGDLYGFPSAQGEYFHGNYTPTSTMSPMSNVGSVYNISPPSAILTPSSEMDSYSDINLDSVCETASQLSNSPSPQEDARASDFPGKTVMECKTVTLPRAEGRKATPSPGHKDLIDVLKRLSESRRNPEQADSRVKMVALTLKQYIKTCGEIVNVDFKTLSGKEMIVIEYRPINSKSNQNKYLIKPLDRFLEDWNSTEEKLNNSTVRSERGRSDWPRLINGFSDTGNTEEEERQLSAILNTLENKYTGAWLDESKIKSIKNKFVVKSIEMLPDSADGGTRKVVKGDVEKSYKVNESVISDGKIKMRLIKDKRSKKVEDEAKREESAGGSAPPKTANPTGAELPPRPNNCQAGCRKKQNKPPSPEGKVRKLSFGKFLEKERNGRKYRAEGKEDAESATDGSDLIEQINRSFEDYLKSIVKVNGCCGENEAPPSEEGESSSGEEDSETDANRTSADAIKFVTQLLSVLATFSRSSSVPPLSITINFGSGGVSPSVQFNLQTGGSPAQRKRRSKKLTVSSFDGPADTSSSEESLEGKPAAKTPSKKRLRKDLTYRPLNVVIQKTPVSGLSDRKRKLPPGRNLAEELMAEGSVGSDGGAVGSGGGGGGGAAATQKHRRVSNKRGRGQALDQAQSKKSKLKI